MRDSKKFCKPSPKFGDYILEDGRIFSPEQYERLVNKAPIKGIFGTVSKGKAKVGDIVLSNNRIVTLETFQKNNLSLNDTIGIVSVPLYNESIRITPTTNEFYSEIFGINDEETGQYKKDIPITGTVIPSDTIVGTTQENCVFSTNEPYNQEVIQDTTHGYYFINDSPFVPCSVLNTKEINPNFIINSETNPLADFNGQQNTKDLLLKASTDDDFPAAYVCNSYKKGGLKWYLPALGELVYYLSNLKAVNDTRVALGLKVLSLEQNPIRTNILEITNLLSSTVSDTSEVYSVILDGAHINTQTSRNESIQIIPFAEI